MSSLTTSNLPWFMDLTFHVSMQYCSLEHWTLLPSPVTSTTPSSLQDGRVKGHVLIFCKNSKITARCRTAINRRMLDPTEKKIPHIQGQRRRPREMIGRAKLHLESNPIPSRDGRRAHTHLAHTKTQRPYRDWARTVFECLLWRYRSTVDCCRCRLWMQQTWVWHKPSWRRSPLTSP